MKGSVKYDAKALMSLIHSRDFRKHKPICREKTWLNFVDGSIWMGVQIKLVLIKLNSISEKIISAQGTEPAISLTIYRPTLYP